MEQQTRQRSVNPLITNRWSPRAFQNEPLSDDAIRSIFEAGRLAPSSFNLQPWRFIYGKQTEQYDFNCVLDVLLEVNQEWAQEAPLLVLAIAEMNNPLTGDPNPHAWHDVGLAVAHMVLQAESVGIKAHQMGGFDAAKAKEQLDIPEGFEPVSVTAFGYPGAPEQLPAKFQESERQHSGRHSMEELVFTGCFGNKLAL